MKWNETNYPRIGETVLRTTLPNGLTVAVVPKPLYRKRYAFFTTRYGGMDMRFRLDGVWHDTPAGIAHYLEHKMFDTEDGNALQVLSQNGAEPNAFTSNATTAYYFDCTEHFEENLRILLSFVSVPYFTQESVDKERGIIGQEIRMVEDTPDWRVYTNLLECLYHSSPARVAIAGTVESIAEITPETLYACHKAFYDPANMMLCVVGDVKPDEIAAIAEEILPESRGEVIERDYGQEEMRVVEKFRREAMEVSMPQFLVGFKCPPAADGAALMRQDIIADIACDILLGDSSPLYQRLYDKGSSTAASAAASTSCPASPTSTRAATVMRPRRSCAPFWTRRSASRARAWTRRSISSSAARASARRCARSTASRTSPCRSPTARSAALIPSASPRCTIPSPARMWRRFCARASSRSAARCPFLSPRRRELPNELSQRRHQLSRAVRRLALYPLAQAARHRQRHLLVRRAHRRGAAHRPVVLHEARAALRSDRGRRDRHCALGHPLCHRRRAGLLCALLPRPVPPCGRQHRLGGDLPHLGRRACHLRRHPRGIFDRVARLPKKAAQPLGACRLLRGGLFHRTGHRALGQLLQPRGLRRHDRAAVADAAVDQRHLLY